ncbi:hypothetical protein LTR78_000775 [Recurvomyces mirabilis]|uniref:Uncharacterized protein n=1 Tax=Recurvomyces mirabilis TaxID=574656 RepID=A0AAE0WW74_9PEZI|nr:hypothetical protein LTR78_000775 [Recurvomyces mirabilis]KAK5158744.1 hypothetical protein LTS14_002852 [Recurvomyces mirabilis]
MSQLAKAIRWLGMPTFLAAISYTSPGNLIALTTPLIATPTLSLAYWHHRQPKENQVDLDTLTYLYTFTATLGLALSLSAQLLLTPAVSRLLFGKDWRDYLRAFMQTEIKPGTPEIAAANWAWIARWQHWVFLATVPTFLAGGVEEILKYCAIAFLRRKHQKQQPQQQSREKDSSRRPPHPSKSHYLQYALTASLAYCTMESIGFIRTMDRPDISPAKATLMVCERIFIGGLGHCLTSCLLAANAASLGDYREGVWDWWRILREPILFHGGFNLVLFALSGWNGNVGWVHPDSVWQIVPMLGVVAGIQGVLFWRFRRVWRSLEADEVGK